MNVERRSWILVLVFSFITRGLLGQENLRTIRVIDNLTKKPVKDASIFLNDSTLTQTNYLGFAQIEASDGDTVLISNADYNKTVFVVLTEKRLQTGIDPKELSYTGGLGTFYTYIGEKVKYPAELRKKGTQSVIYIEFEIDSEGKSNIIEIHNDIKGVFKSYFEEIFKMMPGSWDPAYAGRIFLLPVRFLISSLPPPTTPDRPVKHFDYVMTDVFVTSFPANAFKLN